MPFRWGQPGLIDYLGDESLSKLSKARFFGGRYLDNYGHSLLLADIYQTGAVLGRAQREKQDNLERMLEAPWKEPDFLKACQRDAQDRLDKFQHEAGREPYSFVEFILIEEFIKAIENDELRQKLRAEMSEKRHWLQNEGQAEQWAVDWSKGINAPSSEGGKLAKALQRKIRIQDAGDEMTVFGQEGIGFGVSFPELTERMFNASWSSATLEQKEKEILRELAGYASRYYPEQLDAMELKDNLKAEEAG